MTDRDGQFWPESHTEQLDQLARAASHSPGPTTPAARLVEDLRTVYTEYTQAGERVWVRLAERLAERDETPDTVRLKASEELQADRFAQMQVERGQFATQSAPQPKSPRRFWRVFTLVAAVLACAALLGSTLWVLASIHPPVEGTIGASATPRATGTPAGIQLGPQRCPAAVQSSAYWETITGTGATQKVEGVLCGYLIGAPSLQAVVKVRYGGTAGLLDIDVYANITSTHPSRIFRLQGLLHGDAGISNYNTLLTAEFVKPSQRAGVPSPPGQQDLYREFKWSDGAGTLVQIAFPGLYPDLTRYQAEFEQGEVNTGQGFQQWRLSAVTTAQNFAEFVLGWDANAPTTILSGGGTHDAKAFILVKNPSAGGATIKLSLSRLELNTNGGIWEVTGVATDGMTIASPQNAQQLTSPGQVRGVDTAFPGKPTTIMVFDQDRTEIGQAAVAQSSGLGKPTFSMSISFSSSLQGEVQEGIIALYAYMGNHVIAGAVMVKVLLSA